MASVVAMTPSPQAPSIECLGRTCKPVSGNVVSMLSSSFLGDRSQLILCPCSVSQGRSSRTFLALFVRMDSPGARLFARDLSSDGDDISSLWNADKSRTFPTYSQRAAVSTVDYAIAENGIDMSSFRRGRGLVLEERSGVDFLGQSDDGAGNAEGAFVASAGGSDISRLGLKDELVQALTKRGITHLFPIQDAVLKPAMESVDIIGRAKTGTGKTLAFGIPIIQNILVQNGNQAGRRFRRVPQALVLAPTRELAIQVEKEFMESAPSLSTVCVYGGVSITGQQRKLQKGVDIVVGTPGRIIDLIERGSLVLNEIRFMVLDEADQMLAVGFEEDVEKILEELPTDRQGMLFSATMPSWVSKLAKRYLKSPLNIDLVGESEEKLAEGIKIYSVATTVTAKRSILSDLITVYAKGGKTIVFTQTKKDADEIALSMSRMLGTEALHGDISQAQREKTLKAFRSGKFTVLVATDVAARGLDIPNVDLIIHFEIPNDPETFVHRSGRTGRAGKEGKTILMHSDSQSRTVRMIERDIGCKFERIGPPNVADVLRSSSEQAEEALNRVHPELKTVFLPTAERLLKEQGPEALAAAIAHLSGFTQPPSSRSLITHQEGWMTLQITRVRGWGGRLSSVRNVMGALSSIYPRAADEVGKIHLLDEQEGDGAVFDLPEEVAKEFLTKDIPAEDSIVELSKLPRLLYDEDAPRDKYGRFSQRGGGVRMGGKSDWSTRRTQSDRSFGTRTQSDRPFGTRTQSDRSFATRDWNRGKRQDDDWTISRRNDDRSSSWNDNWSRGRPQEDESPRRFSLQGCFICGEQGHRAAVCPNRK